jgi:hypothetical protein
MNNKLTMDSSHNYTVNPIIMSDIETGLWETTSNILYEDNIEYTVNPLDQMPVSYDRTNDIEVLNYVYEDLNELLLNEKNEETIKIVNEEIKIVSELCTGIKNGTARIDSSQVLNNTIIRLGNKVEAITPIIKHIASLKKIRRMSLENQKTTIDFIRESQNI